MTSRSGDEHTNHEVTTSTLNTKETTNSPAVFSNTVLFVLVVRLSAKTDTILFSLDSIVQQLRNEIHNISYSMVLNQKISGFSPPETLERHVHSN